MILEKVAPAMSYGNATTAPTMTPAMAPKSCFDTSSKRHFIVRHRDTQSGSTNVFFTS